MLRGNQGDPIIAGFCMAMAGAWLGFLLHNRNPAKAFMGDTGSLPLGAALCGVALLSNSLWALLIMGGVFLAESLSVILQVWFFKVTKNNEPCMIYFNNEPGFLKKNNNYSFDTSKKISVPNFLKHNFI